MKKILSKWTRGPQHDPYSNTNRIMDIIANGVILLTLLVIMFAALWN
jgi:hypothetical protein